MSVEPDSADRKPESKSRKAKGKGPQIGYLFYISPDLELVGEPSPKKEGSQTCSVQSKATPHFQHTRHQLPPCRRVAIDSCGDPTCGISTELKCQDRGGGIVAISDGGELYIFGTSNARALASQAVRTQQYILVRNVVGILPKGEVVTLHRQADQQKCQDEAYFIAGDTNDLQVITEPLKLDGDWKSVTTARWKPLRYSDVFDSPCDPQPPSSLSFILQYWSTQYTVTPKDPNALFFYIEKSGSKAYFKLGSLNKAKLYGVFEWDEQCVAAK